MAFYLYVANIILSFMPAIPAYLRLIHPPFSVGWVVQLKLAQQ
jgi:hypothetical protein